MARSRTSCCIDTTSRAFAVSWRDKAQDWTVFIVGGGHTDPSWLAPANWSPGDEDPFPSEPTDETPTIRCDEATLSLENHRLMRDGRAWPTNCRAWRGTPASAKSPF